MDSVWAAFISSLWLGILTSISPCPLASNVAAISFVSRRVAHTRLVLLNGFSYTLGRMIAYTLLGMLIIWSVLSVPRAANFLQKYMNLALGPILLIVGLFLLDVIRLNIPSLSIPEERKKKLAECGLAGTFALGFVFALSFCPISAALFFGSLIPLALKHDFGAVLPLIYGAGTAIPVLIFACAVALGVRSVSAWFHDLSRTEKMARKITGIIFAIVAIYYIKTYIFRL